MRRSHRSPLTAMMREAHAASCQSRTTGAPIDEVTDARAERRGTISRRRILAGAAAVAGSLVLPRRSWAIGQPRVVVVGGGIAGLTCADRLWRKRGIVAQIYEWDDRAGGRIQTLRGYFADGETTEQHAEFISSEHAATLRLAQHLGLALDNTYDTRRGTRDTNWFGSRYAQKDLNRDWRDFGWQLFNDAAHKAPQALYYRYSHDAYAWDHMSVTEWIDQYVPGGLASPFGKLCYADVISEYGGPPENQSALNLIYILGFNASSADGYQSPLTPMLAGSDEKWHIEGGNDQLISGLVSRLPPGAVNLGHRLVAVGENSDGSHTCTFATDSTTVDVVADHVVLAIPFTTLRNVDLQIAMTPLKKQAIASLTMGNNAKIQIQVARRPWIRDGYTGSVLCDAPLDGGWDGSTYQAAGKHADSEIYIAFPGGADGAALASRYALAQDQGPAPMAMVSDTLAQLEPILPGVTQAWQAGPRLAWYNDGNIDPHLLGAWSQYTIGQYTGFSGIEGQREGNVHFAGEHTSTAFQGYIEGAVRSGLRVSAEI